MPKMPGERGLSGLLQWGFPQQVLDILRNRGITQFNSIQSKSIDSGLFTGNNQLIVAPTSSGKTLVAELSSIHHALHRKGAFYLVSLKALAEEKYELFRRFWTIGDEPILRTGITTGDRDFDDENLSQCKVTFATYEKFFGLVRDSPELLKHVSLIVVDEFHSLGDTTRGFGLEAGLTWIRLRHPEIQLIGLSAALPNADEVGAWLDAKVCRSTERDIPLIEEVWSPKDIHWKIFGQGTDALQKRTNPTESVETIDIIQHLLTQKQTPIVVFCMTKTRAEQLAHQHVEIARRKASLVKKGLQELKQLLLFFTEGGPTGKSLMSVVDAGIAFHHADLTYDERRLIEERVRDGAIEVTYSTTTLGQGVNLPVAVVVFDDVFRKSQESYIGKREYINMAGRAGRRGLQQGGTSILICRNARDRRRMTEYISEEAEPVESMLEERTLDMTVLNVLVASGTSTINEIQLFLKSSFFGQRSLDKNPALLKARVDAVPKIVRQLCKDGFAGDHEDGKFGPTEFGRVISRKGVTPSTGKELLRRLKILSKSVGSPVDGDQHGKPVFPTIPAVLHLLLDVDGEFGMYEDYQAHAFLDRYRPTVCKLRPFDNPSNPYLALQVAWILGEWVEGIPYANLCAPFRFVREGNIRATADHCSWLVDCAASMSRISGFGLHGRLPHFLSVLAKRLRYGVTESGVPLMDVIWNRSTLGVELGGIGRSKVQELVARGFNDLNTILEADRNKLLLTIRDGKQVERLRHVILMYLESVSNSLRPSHVRRAHHLSQEQLIKNLYDKRGKDFEVAAYNLLNTIGIDVHLLDEKKVPGCADLLVRTSQGTIQVECKTRENGLVSNTEAFEVLGKSRVGEQPAAYVTIGKPGFAETAIANSYDKQVTLISHKIVAEAAIQVLEGKRKKEDVESLLLAKRYVDVVEFRQFML